MGGLAEQLQRILAEDTDGEPLGETFQPNIAAKLSGPLKMVATKMGNIQDEFNQAAYSIQLIAKDPRRYRPQFDNLIRSLNFISSGARAAAMNVEQGKRQVEGVELDGDLLDEAYLHLSAAQKQMAKEQGTIPYGVDGVDVTLSNIEAFSKQVLDNFRKLAETPKDDARRRHRYLGLIVGGLNQIATEAQHTAKSASRVLDKMPRG